MDKEPVNEIGCGAVVPNACDDVAMILSGQVQGIGRSGSRMSSVMSVSFNSGDGVLPKGSAWG